jgi:excisionase family DNA binding protein
MQANSEMDENRVGGPPPSLADDLLDGAAAAAEFLGISRTKVYRMTAEGNLPAIHKGKRIFYRKSELERAFQAAA